ncbi:MAG: CPBP family intramembrane glutamic endopeptidase [Janthinobacterium lividum]
MIRTSFPAEARSFRSWLGLIFLVAAFFAFDPVENAIYRPLAHAFGLHMIADNLMGLPPYAVLMAVRLFLDLVVVAGVCAILSRRLPGFPLTGPSMPSHTLRGFAVGLLVMTGAILLIIATGNATLVPAGQSAASSFMSGSGWLVFDFLGAMGEELFGRVAVLLVAERLVGRRGAILASGLIFSILHLGNPGATWVWLLRIFLQGMLLAYAVYCTRSFWWSTGYHTGWNWANAPLFGAAGSGYLDRGHLLDFTPTGSGWVTGGAVGPEGSIFAFVAVLCAFGLLIVTTRGRSPEEPLRS